MRNRHVGTVVSNQDPLLYIRQADPVDPAELEKFAVSPTGLAIRDRVLASDPSEVPAPMSPLRRRRVARVAVVTAVLIASLTAAAVLASRPTINPLTVGCYQAASQEADTAVFILDPEREDLGPVGVCATAWPAAFGEPTPDNLVACVVTGGGLGVFPAAEGLSPRDACNAIGASPVGDGTYVGLAGAKVRQLDSQLRDRHSVLQGTESGCIGATELAAEFESIIDQVGATGWVVVDRTVASDTWTTPDGAAQPVTSPTTTGGSVCADFVIEATEGQVLLITHWPPLLEN